LRSRFAVDRSAFSWPSSADVIYELIAERLLWRFAFNPRSLRERRLLAQIIWLGWVDNVCGFRGDILFDASINSTVYSATRTGFSALVLHDRSPFLPMIEPPAVGTFVFPVSSIRWREWGLSCRIWCPLLWIAVIVLFGDEPFCTTVSAVS
jgi:hypothetical protein